MSAVQVYAVLIRSLQNLLGQMKIPWDELIMSKCYKLFRFRKIGLHVAENVMRRLSGLVGRGDQKWYFIFPYII
jgi:hypothetical protein